MYWIAAAVVLILLLAVPRARPAAVVGCVVLGAMLVWALVQRWNEPGTAVVSERGRPTTPAQQLEAVPVEVLEVSDLTLSGGGAPYRLTGRVKNGSETLRLKSLMVDIKRSDCYPGALDPSGCAVQWRARHWVEVTVPPQETRAFEVAIWARGEAPRRLGTLRDDFEIVAATGESVTETRQ
jgi:hypothetical protein